MSIVIEPEVKSFQSQYERLKNLADFAFHREIIIGDGERRVSLKSIDPDVNIITDAIKAYAEARMERCKMQDKIDKINLTHALINELGEALLNQKPEEVA